MQLFSKKGGLTKNMELVWKSLTLTLTITVWSVNSQSVGGNEQNSISNTGYYLQLYNSINSYRARHVAPSLKWNRTLNENAESLAQQLAQSPNSFSDPEEFEGVIYFEIIGSRPPVNLVASTWYNESNSFNFKAPSHTEGCLNFTQMIWKSSTTVGIGTATFNNLNVVLAKFSPIGNIKGRFKLNCLPQTIIPVRRLK